MLSSQRLCPSSCSSFVAFIPHLGSRFLPDHGCITRRESPSAPIVQCLCIISRKRPRYVNNRKRSFSQPPDSPPPPRTPLDSRGILECRDSKPVPASD